jgi:hypothetical protein
MSIPTFEFSLRDAASRDTKRAFVDVMLSTGRFARNEKGTLSFRVTPGTKDWCPLHRAPDFGAVLADADVIRITGADLTRETVDCLWFWASEYRWKFPRIGGAWNPDRPLPIRNVGQVRR